MWASERQVLKAGISGVPKKESRGCCDLVRRGKYLELGGGAGSEDRGKEGEEARRWMGFRLHGLQSREYQDL